MKYVVITTKHHEGFCLWDTQLTDYKTTNTAYAKDALAPHASTPSAPKDCASASTTR